MPYPPVTNARPSSNGTGRYGAASNRDFDNPSKWTTVPSIPVLDEHELTDESGKVIGYVDKGTLEEIAANNNRRVIETNDPAPIIVGHTSDDPQAPERPVSGYAVNYQVKPFKRDPETGRVIFAIHADYKVRKGKEHVIEDFPRRSVELWLGRKELDPIALLGGTTPERDLGVIIRKSRISGHGLSVQPPETSIGYTPANDGPALHYSKRGTVLRYSLSADEGDDEDQPIDYSCKGNGMSGMNGSAKGKKVPAMAKATTSKKKMYEADADDGMETDDFGGGGGMDDTAPPMNPHDDMGEGDPGAEDPGIAAIFQSKAFKQALAEAVKEGLQSMLAEEEGGAAGGAGAQGAAPPPPPMGGADGGMDGGEGDMGPDGTDGLAPQPDEEARIDHEAPPVRFGANCGTGMAGPQSTSIPAMGGTKGNRYSRTSQQQQPRGNPSMNRTQPQQQRRQQDPEVLRLRRQLDEVLIRNARIEAEKIVSDFLNNAEGSPEGGVLFADPEGEVNLIAEMDPNSRKFHIENIRRNYRRQGSVNPMDPTQMSGAASNLVRYGRSSAANEPASDDNYEPATPAEAVLLADTQSGKFTGGKAMTPGEAVKYLREKGRIRPTRR